MTRYECRCDARSRSEGGRVLHGTEELQRGERLHCRRAEVKWTVSSPMPQYPSAEPGRREEESLGAEGESA